MADFPHDSEYGEDLGLTYFGLGGQECRSGKHDKGLEWLNKAIKVWETALQHPSHQVRLPRDLAQAHAGRGTCLWWLGRYAESLAAFDRSLALAQDPFATQGRQMALFELRQASAPALRLAREGDHARAAAAAAALRKGPNAHPEMDFNVACVYAVCVDKVKSKDPKAAAEYARQAVLALQQAHKEGLFKDPEMRKLLQQDRDLDALRGRPDFIGLLREATGASR